MGAYLSAPNTEKVSSDNTNEFLQIGASSMQGWRISQEDAHNCILDFDEHTSFFSVYDGHGGSEVAMYCAERLPAFLKELPAYKDGDFEQALKDAFLGFDKTLLDEEVIEELKRLAERNPNRDSEIADDDEEEEDLMELCQEGALPLTQVLEKYKDNAAARFPHLNKLKQDDAGASGSGMSKPQSPFLRGRRNLNETQNAVNAALKFAGDSACGPSSSTTSVAEAGGGKGPLPSLPDLGIGDSCVSSSCGKSDVSASNSANSADNSEIISSKSEEVYEASSNSGTNGTASPIGAADSSSSDAARSIVTATSLKVKTRVQNGDITSSSSSSLVEVLQCQNEGNGEVSSFSKTVKAQENRPKCSSGSSGISSSTLSGEASASSKAKAKVATTAPGEVDDSSSDDDVDFHAEEENSSTEDGEEDCEAFDDESEEDENEEGEDEETDDDEEGLLDDDDTAFCRNMIEEPGKDSGCTAVVALINGRDLYVANAGDSRCVVCRNGKAIEMSLDHKPEDEEETDRIHKAGGKVTLDGRVNGGLNLSRAIGDHAYKMNQDLPPEKQMISALPDVRKLIISPEDDFMILACDGIWNFMSSDEVVEFVKKRLNEGCDKLSQICEELFDHCLAPNTMGDGTGCDNMTAVIVCFKPALRTLFTKISAESEAIGIASSTAKKRAALVSSDLEEDINSVETDTSSSDGGEVNTSPPTAKKRPASPTRSDDDVGSVGESSISSGSSEKCLSKRIKTDNEAIITNSVPEENEVNQGDVPMSTVTTSSVENTEARTNENDNECITPSTSTT